MHGAIAKATAISLRTAVGAFINMDDFSAQDKWGSVLFLFLRHFSICTRPPSMTAPKRRWP
jgi:hypothetical protein